MQLQPYIFFYGRCDEALAFYKDVFGGSAEVMRVEDTPVIEHMPAEARTGVMHASFTAPGVNFFASDGRERKPVDPDAGNMSLAVAAADQAEGERLISELGAGGKVSMPFDDAFWGGKFGMVVDRFGNEWMITAP